MRSIVLVALLAPAASAAPRLKPEKPAPPAPEDARIEALKAKYDELRRTGNPAQRRELAGSALLVRALATLAEQDRGTDDGAGVKARLQRTLAEDPLRRDLCDILMYDRARQKVPDGK